MKRKVGKMKAFPPLSSIRKEEQRTGHSSRKTKKEAGPIATAASLRVKGPTIAYSKMKKKRKKKGILFRGGWGAEPGVGKFWTYQGT